MNNTVHQFLDDESIDALTHVYLELSLPLNVARWAAAADLRDLGLQKTDSHWSASEDDLLEWEACLLARQAR
jgi:hypothetical protein